MLDTLIFIWVLIGIIVGGGVLLTMGVFAIGLIVSVVMAIIKGLRGK